MARSTRKAQNCRKPNTICKYMLMQIFSNFFSIFLQVLCQSRVFQMWLSFATASTSAYKSSDWTQNIIQIHDDLPLWTTDLPTTTLLEFKVIFFFFTKFHKDKIHLKSTLSVERKKERANSQTLALLRSTELRGDMTVQYKVQWQ